MERLNYVAYAMSLNIVLLLLKIISVLKISNKLALNFFYAFDKGDCSDSGVALIKFILLFFFYLFNLFYGNKACWCFMTSRRSIKKTCPCKIYPLQPHFYIVKLGFTGVCLFFLFLLQNIDCGYSLEPPRRAMF